MAKIGRHTAPISPFDHWSSDRLRLLRAVEGKRYPNPTLFGSREASEPYSRGQWYSALKATPHSPKDGNSRSTETMNVAVLDGLFGTFSLA